MKIACQSCGAKYSIADDKVQGKKVFKIKCKKCSSDIIVRGDQASPGDSPSADVSAGLAAVGADQFPEDEATRVVGGSGDNDPIWHAAIDDNNTGPFSLAQLKQFAASGQVNGETSVWKDGFADWKPVKDVPELAVQLLSAGGVAAPASVPAAAGGDALFGGGAPSAASSGGGLFAAESKPAAKAAARTAKAGASNDLFGGGAKSSMFGDEAVETSAASSSAASSSAASSAASAASSASSAAASPKLDAASMTGQRNENSVLFSLATLQQVAGSAPAKTETKKDADASGLIDIKSMAGTMGPGGPGSSKSAVDEILSVGGGGGLASPLAAPVLAPMPAAAVPAAEPPKSKGSNTTVIASVLGAAVILVGGGLGAVYLLKSGQPQTQVGTEGSGPNTANAPNNGNGNGNGNNGNGNNGQNNNPSNNGSAANAGPNNAGTPSTNGAATAPGPAGTQPAGTAPAGNEPSNRAERTPRATRSSSPSGSSNNSAPSSPSTSPTPSNNSPSSAPAGGSCAARCRGDIACLLSCGTQTRPASNGAPSTASSAPSNAPETPGRNDVLSAMRGVQGAVRACASGQPGPATVSITFASSGRVTTANVAPPFAGTPAGSCIARAVRSATVPAFSRPTFNVNYPFAL